MGSLRALRRRFPARRWAAPNLSEVPRRRRYVAYLDLLGFGGKVEADCKAALNTYDRIFARIREMSPRLFKATTIAVASDSVLLTSTTLKEIARACHYIQHFALFEDTLVRGGVAYGVHIEARRGQNLYVVSPALVRAVRLEQSIGHPCVALDPGIKVPASYYPRPGMLPLQRLLFFYDGLWVVTPFTMYWAQSAATRVAMMLRDHPEHRKKYRWFLGLYRAVIRGDWLVPEGASKTMAPNSATETDAKGRRGSSPRR